MHLGRLSLRLAGAGSDSGLLTMTGLTNGGALPGSHAGISVGFPTGVTAWTSQAWGVSSFGDTTYGTGSTNPSDFTASDGLTLLWEGSGRRWQHLSSRCAHSLCGAHRCERGHFYR